MSHRLDLRGPRDWPRVRFHNKACANVFLAILALIGCVATPLPRAMLPPSPIREVSCYERRQAALRMVENACLCQSSRFDRSWPTAVRLFSEPTMGKADLQMRD